MNEKFLDLCKKQRKIIFLRNNLMLPISLTIKGLYSYQKEQTIDFARLTSANIFGIFGNVGSGKSSILEAITFALFGETERMNIRDNRAYNMLNLKSGELFIKFIFHQQNDQYQIVVKGKRNRKNFEKVETTRDAYSMSEGEWKPLEINKIQEIIGLNYENFRRTIIIPQGQFQEFLQLSGTDRSKMMKELFNLERFELFEKVKSVETKNNNKINNLVGQLAQVGNVNPDDIEKKINEREAIRKQLELLAAQKIETQTIETEFANLQKLFQDIDKQQQAFDNLKTKSARKEFSSSFDTFVKIGFKSESCCLLS
jgi:exonuclease SbcC